MYTKAVVNGIIYPNWYFEIKYVYIKKLIPYKAMPVTL